MLSQSEVCTDLVNFGKSVHMEDAALDRVGRNGHAMGLLGTSGPGKPEKGTQKWF